MTTHDLERRKADQQARQDAALGHDQQHRRCRGTHALLGR
jgi:hypothetical protein